MTLEEKLDSKQAIALSVYGMLESAMKLSKNNFINSQPTYLIPAYLSDPSLPI